jgi:tetratricopeptide (TPR) repeat protein
MHEVRHVSDKPNELPDYRPPADDQPAVPFVKGAYDGDVAYFTRHIESHPADPVGYERRAKAHHLNDDFDLAIADYTTAMGLSPESYHLLLLRASAYEDRADERHPVDPQDLRRAAEDCSEFIRRCPNDAGGWRNRGRLLSRLHEDDNAIADYSEAIRCDPNPDSYFHRGSARARRGQIEAAIEDFDETIRLEGANGTADRYSSRTRQAFAERGRALAQKGELERAITDYDAAVQRRFTAGGRLYIERGLARKRQGDHRGALADFEISLQGYLPPKEKAAALFERGSCHRTLGDPERAASDFRDALSLDGDHREARRALELVRALPQTWTTSFTTLMQRVSARLFGTKPFQRE